MPSSKVPKEKIDAAVAKLHAMAAYKDANMVSGVQHAVEGASVAHERNMADTSRSQVITSNNDSSTNYEVALSNSGTGKLSFTCNSADHPDFNMPDMESVCKEMEARCLRTYKILEPNFSVMKLLQDTCQCIVDLGYASSGPRESGMVQIVPAMDFLSKPSVSRVLQPNEAGSLCMPPNNHIIHGGIFSSSSFAGEQSSSSNMLVIAKRPAHDVNDIAKGEEHVFLTPGKKGWGLRAPKELPQGAFICEYVGEILTNNELDERNTQGTSKGRHTYPTLLDADRDTEEVLGDDQALCLDATYYGNVARFMNHRCHDANLIDIHVQIETPDRHYYHVAFLTKRKIEPFEELTWTSTTLSRHSNVAAEASTVGTKVKTQDLNRKPWHGSKIYEYWSRDIRHHGHGDSR